METTIPFTGFYHSVHSENIDYALEQLFSDANGDRVERLESEAYDLIEWGAIFNQYAKDYAECFAGALGLKTLKYKELDSPREYNFTTDRIICEIDVEEVKRLIKEEVNSRDLRECIKERFTDRSGFISFYENDLDKWSTKVEDWDHNEVGTLIESYAKQESEEYYRIGWIDELLYLGDSYYQEIQNVICDSLSKTEEGGRLLKIRDYIIHRQEREFYQSYNGVLNNGNS